MGIKTGQPQKPSCFMSSPPPQRLEAEVRQERRQLDNLVNAVAEGKAPAAVLEKIRTLEASIAARSGPWPS